MAVISSSPQVEPAPKMFEVHRTPHRGRLVNLGVLSAVLFVLGLLLLIFILVSEPEEIGLLALPTVMTSIGLGMGILFVQKVLARRLIEAIILELDSSVVHLDDAFKFRVRFTPKADIEINAAVAAFECVEKAYYRAGTRSRMYTKVVFSTEDRVASRLRCRNGQTVSFEHSFATPADGMCTFHGINNAVTWRLRLHIRIARWPDVKEDFEIQVLPIVGDRPSGQ